MDATGASTRDGRIEMIKLLIGQGTRLDNDENSEAGSPSAIASSDDEGDAVRYLVQSGANLNGLRRKASLRCTSVHTRKNENIVITRKGVM